MPVYLFTFHAYRTWRPNHPKGYVRHGAKLLPPDHGMARRYDRHATQPPVFFTNRVQAVLVDGAADICRRRGWRLHAVVTDPTHVHLLVSWRSMQQAEWKHVHGTLKRLLGMLLTQRTGKAGRRWFVRKGSRRRVRDREHFDHLMKVYLPRHRGRQWFER